MQSPSQFFLPKTKIAETFEAVSRDVLTAHYGVEYRFYGGKGQSQHGIDLYAAEPGTLFVAQCKNHLKEPSKAIVRLSKEIEKDIRAAAAYEDFKHMSRFDVLTSLDRQSELCNLIIRLNREFTFKIEIWFWQEIEEELLSHENLLERYYSDYTDERLTTSAKNSLITCLKQLRKGSIYFIKNRDLPLIQYGDMYIVCAAMWAAKAELIATEAQFHLQLMEIKVRGWHSRPAAKCLESLVEQIPVGYQPDAGIAGHMTVRDFINRFERDAGFPEHCEAVIAELEKVST